MELFPERDYPESSRKAVRDTYDKLPEKVIHRVSRTIEKAKDNPSLKGQFRKAAVDLERGSAHLSKSVRPPKKPRRKRGYDDKGSLRPTEDRYRAEAYEFGEVQVDYLDYLGFEPLVDWCYRTLPGKLIFTTERGKDYIKLRELEALLEDPDWKFELGPHLLEIANEYDQVLDSLGL